MTIAVGFVHPTNPVDARCPECVDFDSYSRLIWEGEKFTCTYCKREFPLQEQSYWKDTVCEDCGHPSDGPECPTCQAVETSELISSTLKCDCNTCEPGLWCEECPDSRLMDGVCPLCAPPVDEVVDMGDVELTSCVTCDRGVDVYKGTTHVGHLYPFSTRKRYAVRLSENCGIIGRPEPIWDKFSDDPYEVLMVGVEGLIETI